MVVAYVPLAKTFLQKYMDSDKKQVNTTFGIQYDNGVPMIGGKVINIDLTLSSSMILMRSMLEHLVYQGGHCMKTPEFQGFQGYFR